MNKVFVISTEVVNLRKIKVLTSGIDLSVFKDNPVMLLGHNTEKVLGKWVNINKEQNDALGLILTGETEFDNDELSQDIANKVNKNYIKGVSIGGDIIEAYVTEENEVDVLVITKMLLKEVSITPLPANMEAVVIGEGDVKLSADTNDLELSYGGSKDVNEMFNKFAKKEVTKIKETELTLADVVNEVFGTVELSLVKSKLNDLIDSKKKVELELQALQSNILTKELDNILEVAVKEGKVKSEQKEDLIKLSSSNVDNLKSILSMIKSPVIRLTDEIRNTNKEVSNEKNYEWYMRNDSKGLKLMSTNEPLRFEKLKAEYLAS